jgi:hypothetical protein
MRLPSLGLLSRASVPVSGVSLSTAHHPDVSRPAPARLAPSGSYTTAANKNKDSPYPSATKSLGSFIPASRRHASSPSTFGGDDPSSPSRPRSRQRRTSSLSAEMPGLGLTTSASMPSVMDMFGGRRPARIRQSRSVDLTPRSELERDVDLEPDASPYRPPSQLPFPALEPPSSTSWWDSLFGRSRASIEDRDDASERRNVSQYMDEEDRTPPSEPEWSTVKASFVARSIQVAFRFLAKFTDPLSFAVTKLPDSQLFSVTVSLASTRSARPVCLVCRSATGRAYAKLSKPLESRS